MHQRPLLVLLAALPLAAATLPGMPRWAEAGGQPGFQARCRAAGVPAGACRIMAVNITLLLREEPAPAAFSRMAPAGART